MNFQLAVNPLPFPQFLNDISTLKFILGFALFSAGGLVFSLWRERLYALKEDERAKFLMFNLVGGSWLLAVFAVCGGMYFLADSIIRFGT